MAVLPHMSHDIGNPLLSLLMFMLALCTIGLLVGAMARKSAAKAAAKEKGKGIAVESSRPYGGDDSDSDSDDDEDGGEQRKKARAEENRLRKKWEERLLSRQFTCERQLDASNMGSHPVIAILHYHGLDKFLEPIDGYRYQMVIDFYTHIEIFEGREEIIAPIGKKTVRVTPDIIARYLNYERPPPDKLTFPPFTTPHDYDSIVQAITDDPNSFNVGTQRFSAGGLNELHRIVNKIVHYNISPFSKEKRPTKDDGAVIYAMGSYWEKVDWASFIWWEIVHFWKIGNSIGNIPFPAMITVLCEQAGIRGKNNDPLVPRQTGPITLGSMKKSKSMSRSADREKAGPSRPTSSKPSERSDQWFEILCGKLDVVHKNQDAVQRKQHLIETRQKNQGKTMGKLKRWMKWVMGTLEETSGKRYEPTPEDREESDQGEDIEAQYQGFYGGEDSDDDE